MEVAIQETSAPSRSFREQFKDSRTLDGFAGKAELFDLNPPETSDQVPVLLIQGWGETAATHQQSLKTIFESSRRALFVNFPRRDGVRLISHYPEVELRKAESISSAMARSRINRVDVIAHSEGAISATIAAELNPNKFRNIVFVDPAGLIGRDSTVKLAARFAWMLSKDAVRLVKGFGPRSEMLKAATEAAKYFASNPAGALKEANAISSANIYEMLENLSKVGIRISVIHGVNDTLFPMKRVLKTAGEKGGIDTIGFYSVKGDHREISTHPGKYMALALNAIQDLNRQ